ncbi:hypothetical protein BWP39_18085 [Paraburkholderia acidicola]|uniref:Carboxypeptidase C (Cathepsin A) n=1 Tax=Paraburkholderia acidicola TaxID=1912599 RepID=A0A2A4F168_9BURK|nr:peptidase S10 [Paraburkholderia acidicola]PCE26432.1 hypothetical protein BWP39_18085 [Paraburkholderia acidicola]
MKNKPCLAILIAASCVGLSACGGDSGSSSSAAKLNANTQAKAASSAAGALPADQPYTDPNRYSSSASASLAATAAFDKAAITHHSISLDGKPANYTATAGHLTAITSAGDKEVSVFYVAYTLDGTTPGTRPVTFFWNGGPGSSTIWLHLGSWGPRTLNIDEGSLKLGTTAPSSFPMVDNDVTMLDDSDLVFIDATGTGYSEAVAPHKNRDFWSTDKDAGVFRDFINRYVQVNSRQQSPKYLYGESYGGIRTPIVADLLEQQGSPGQGGPALTGVILNSPILSYKTNCYEYGSTSVPCNGFLPSYAGVAYGRGANISNPNQLSLADFVSGMRTFTDQTYAPANSAYLSRGTTPPTSVTTALNGWTAVSAANWKRNFNMQPDTYANYLLNGVGSIDMYNGLVAAPAGANYDGSSYNDTAFQNAINDYLPNFLSYKNASAYNLEPSVIINDWDFTHGSDTSGRPSSLGDIVDVLTLDPSLKMKVFGGYDDLVCPIHQTELDLQGANLAQTVPFQQFPGGHMIYLMKSSRAPMKQAIDTFFAATPAAVAADVASR